MKRVVIPIYNVTLVMFDDIDKQCEYISSEIEESFSVPSTTTGHVARITGSGNEICIFANSLPTLAHESFHAATEVYNIIVDKPFLSESNEPFAYLLEYIFKVYCHYRNWETFPSENNLNKE